MSQSTRLKNLYYSRYCCNPFGKHKQKVTKGIRFVTTNSIIHNPSFNLTTKHTVCATCRSNLAKTPSPKSAQCEPISSSHSSPETCAVECNAPEEFEKDYELSQLNNSLVTFDISPVKKTINVTQLTVCKKEVHESRNNTKKEI